MKNIKLNAAPPIDQRPKCPQCMTPLRPWFETVKHERVYRPEGGFDSQTTVEWRGNYLGYGAFCTLRCCERYANAAYELRRRKG